MSRGRVVGGVALLVLAAAVALEATTFVVGFPTDPLGPSAFPWVAAGLIAIGGAALLAGQGPLGESVASDGVRRIGWATASFVGYALTVAPLGFVLATTLEFLALSLLFGGRPLKGALAGLAFSLLLFAVFVYGLGLPLPLGLLER